MAYMPSNSPVLPVAAAQTEVGISPYVPHSSMPAKFVPYGNLTAGNGGGATQFSQPVRIVRFCCFLIFFTFFEVLVYDSYATSASRISSPASFFSF